MSHITTQQRFEAKYIVSEAEVEAIKHFASPYIDRDENCRGTYGYSILSLYLDNPRLSLFWSSMLGEKNRFKLRFRTYTADPAQPVFLEIKRRVNQVILKQRATMHRGVIPLLLSGAPVPGTMFINQSPRDREAFQSFRTLMESIEATPKVFVRYDREAYSGTMGQDVRLTIDRNLAALECNQYTHDLWADDFAWHSIFAPIVLEIKFTGSYPQWVQALVRYFNLRQDSYSKYVSCLQDLHKRGAMSSFLGRRGEDPLWAAKEPLWDLVN